MKESYYRELAANIEHYIERGNTLEQALAITLHNEEEVHSVYLIIQEEKRRGYYKHESPFAFLKENPK